MTAPLDCKAVVQQLWDYLDEELTTSRMEAVRQHIAVCARCYPHFEFERKFLEAIARCRESAPASDPLRVRVLAALRAEGFREDDTHHG
jgi:mycothiol system anti-sigma-R factor